MPSLPSCPAFTVPTNTTSKRVRKGKIVQIELPDDLHARVKAAAALQRVSLQAYVSRLIEINLSKKS